MPQVSYETLRTISLICFITAGLLLLISVPMWLNSFGGIDGIRRKLKKQSAPMAQKTVIPEPDTVLESMEPEQPKASAALQSNEGASETQMLVRKDGERETEVLQNKKPTEKFRVTREITITHDQEATSDR